MVVGQEGVLQGELNHNSPRRVERPTLRGTFLQTLPFSSPSSSPPPLSLSLAFSISFWLFDRCAFHPTVKKTLERILLFFPRSPSLMCFLSAGLVFYACTFRHSQRHVFSPFLGWRFTLSNVYMCAFFPCSFYFVRGTWAWSYDHFRTRLYRYILLFL